MEYTAVSMPFLTSSTDFVLPLFWFEYNNTLKLFFFYSKHISYVLVVFPAIVLKVPNVAVHQLKQILEKA